MNLSLRFAQQLARPSGIAGQLIGMAMDVANQRTTRFALDLLDARPGERVLDAGCGTGAALEALLDKVAVDAWGVDPSQTMLAAARRRLGSRAVVHGVAIEGLPFPEGSFDAVLALNVLYFADPEGAMIGQLHRVLRPGGRLVAYVTDRDTMAAWPFARAGVHRLYDSRALTEALAAGGFAASHICVHERAITGSVNGLVAVALKDG